MAPAARWTLGVMRAGERPAIRRLVQLYIYDLYGDYWDTEDDGSYGPAPWHRRFWRRSGLQHFVIRVDGRLAGFVLVRDRADIAGPGVREISQFFVLRKYRRRGLGRGAAEMLFGRFPGRWEVTELVSNVAAQRFWRRVIGRCAIDSFIERRCRYGAVGLVVQHFATAKARTRAGATAKGAAAGRSQRRVSS